MKLKVEKGTSMAEVYYSFLYYESIEDYRTMTRFYDANRWWFDNFNAGAKKQCEQKYKEAIRKNFKEVVDETATSFFGGTN